MSPPPHRLRNAAVTLVLLLLAPPPTVAAPIDGPPSGDALWQAVGAPGVVERATLESAFRLDPGALETSLGRAPREGLAPLSGSRAIISLPMPDGTLSRFRIEESPVFEPALAARYPEIRSYRGQGIDLPTATIRFDWTPQGFHALMLSSGLTVSVYPTSTRADADYVATRLADARQAFQCGVIDHGGPGGALAEGVTVTTGSQLRTYRVAISTTGEFTTDLGGGTVPGALAALNTLLNGINAIYERDLAVHINLIAGLEPVIYTNAGTDPYTNGDTNAMIGQVATTLAANVPAGNYDFGHVIGTNSGGLAGVGVVCDNSGAGGPNKAKGVSAASSPIGSTSNIHLVAHEMGHQFGASHTQNAPCGRDALNAIEPGSGVTIMSYGGVCAPNNTAQIGEIRFHSWSLAMMNAYIATRTCQVSTATSNGVPTVNAGLDRTIPVNTPFTLTAVGGDPDPGDVANLTYTWEQVDPGKLNAGATDYPNPPYQDQPGDPSTTTRPVLRARASSKDPSRTFPDPVYILDNSNDPPDQVGGLYTAEELPRVGRTLNFRVTVRDNHAGAGGTNEDQLTLTVSGSSGPFQVTAPNGGGTWTVSSQQVVSWNVSNTDLAPVSCANVKITLSADGGQTFPYVLAGITPNDGSQTIAVPAGLNTTAARVKVESVGNIFFDVSNANFSINAGPGCPFMTSVSPRAGNAGTLVTLGGTGFTGVTGVSFAGYVPAAYSVLDDATITATIPAGATSGSITLTKAACPNVMTVAMTICPGAAQVASVDDGTGETFYSVGSDPQYFVNRLTPSSYPATLSQVLLQFNSFFIPVGTAVTVLAGANPGGTSTIDGMAFQTVAGTTGPDGSFKGFGVAPLTINSGDFVVGFSMSGVTYPGFTDLGSNQGRSYYSGDGESFGQLNGNLLARASYHTNCVMPTTAVEPSSVGPISLAIAPNPAADGSTISFTQPRSGVASVRIVDLAGRVVRVLRDGWAPSGRQELRWDGRDRNGSPVRAGMYFVAVDGAGVKARGKVSIAR